MNENLIDEQHALEEQSVTLGIDRYRRGLEQRGVDSDLSGLKLLNLSLDKMAAAIDAYTETMRTGKAGRGKPATAMKYLANFDPAVAAYITLRSCIGSITPEVNRGPRLAKVGLHIGTLMEEHVKFEEFRAAEPGLVGHMERKLATRNSGWQRRAVLRHALKLTEVRGLEWSEQHKTTVGIKLVELMITELGLFKTEMLQVRKTRRETVVVPTAETVEWLARVQGAREVTCPLHLPMVVPPRPWTNPRDGGYLNRQLNRVTMVRTQLTEDDLFSVQMDGVYRALNAIQSTPWRINRPLLDVMEQARSVGTAIATLPPADDLPIPPKPEWLAEGMETDNLPKHRAEEFKAWKAEAGRTHSENARLISKRMQLATQLAVADRFKDYGAIWFPHNLDFRGRVYPVPASLNPQANDTGKALLEFAEGKPLGEAGAFWLAVHISNLFGNDKVPFESRAQWTVDHEAELMASVADPLGAGDFWMEADEPWQALAACMEWAGYLSQGTEYVSRLPVAMDGSCSGLQHYSAMLKDPQGGAAVNLVPADEPQDIYTKVAELVEEKIADDADLAMWRGKVARKIVKRPCMTYAYSVTQRGIRDQILDEVQKMDGAEPYLGGHDNWQACNALSSVVLEAIEDVVQAAAAGMEFLQGCAGVISGDHGLPLQWVTPIGLPVVQYRQRSKNNTYQVWFEGRRFKFSLGVRLKAIDIKGQKSSVAPNYVHSMDAAHLMLTVNGCLDEGIEDFAMIHDSFGTHACNVDEMNHLLRREFITMYSEDRLAELREQLGESLGSPEELPPSPAMGTLDLSLVQDSDFFFS